MPNISANGGAVQLQGVDGASSIGVQITGTWTGTLAFQMSMDGGATWNNVNAWPVGGGASLQSTSANGNWVLPAVGGTYFQVVATAWTSGTAAVTLQGIKSPTVLVPKTNASGELLVQNSAAQGVQTVQGAVADGGTLSNPVPIGLEENSTTVRIARAMNGPFADVSIGRGVAAVNIPGLATSGTIPPSSATSVTLNPIGAATIIGVGITGTGATVTYNFEGSVDNGTTWIATNAYPQGGGAAVLTASANGNWFVPCSGYTGIRVRNSNGSNTGTATVALQGGIGSWTPTLDGSGRTMVVGASAVGTAVTGNPLTLGGQDPSGNAQVVRTASPSGAAAGTTGLLVTSLHVWDGTNYQPSRQIVDAQGTSGVPAVSNTIWDGSNQRRLLAINQYGDGAAANQIPPGALLALNRGNSLYDRLSTGKTDGSALGTTGAFAVSGHLWDAQGVTYQPNRMARTDGAAGGTTGFLGAAAMLWNATGYQPAVGDTTGTARISPYATNLTATPTITSAAAYASGQLVGGKITLASAVRLTGGNGRIETVALSDKAKQNAAMSVVFFNANPTNTTFTDRAALAVNATDLLTIVGVVSIAAGDYTSFSANSVATKLNQGLRFTCAGSSTLYACLMTTGTPTYASTTDLQLTVSLIQD